MSVRVALIRFTITARLTSGCPRQLRLMYEKSRCSIEFHLLVPGDQKVVHPHAFRLTCRPPRAPSILEVSHQFLLLGVDGDDRLARRLAVADVREDVAKLGVPVGVRRPFARLPIRLQTVSDGGQELGHQLVADAVAHAPQGPRQVPGALRRPPEGGLRIPRGRRLHQPVEVGPQRGVLVDGPLAAPARAPHPAGGHPDPGAEFAEPTARASVAAHTRRDRSVRVGANARGISPGIPADPLMRLYTLPSSILPLIV